MTRLLCTRIFVSVTNKESLTVALAASWRTTVTLVLFDGLEMLQYMVELADRAGGSSALNDGSAEKSRISSDRVIRGFIPGENSLSQVKRTVEVGKISSNYSTGHPHVKYLPYLRGELLANRHAS